MFWRVEAKSGLYVLFKTVCDEYGLIQPENYTIPAEAESLEPELSSQERQSVHAPKVLKRPDDSEEEKPSLPEPVGNHVVALGDTSKRHRHTKSGLPIPVAAPIQEEAEELEDISSLASEERTDKPSTMTSSELEGEASSQTSLDDQEEPTPAAGIVRSDTVKPVKSVADEDADEEGSADVTVIEIDTQPTTEDSSTAGCTDVDLEATTDAAPVPAHDATVTAEKDKSDQSGGDSVEPEAMTDVEENDAKSVEKEPTIKSEAAD
jgi:hypothetical protein